MNDTIHLSLAFLCCDCEHLSRGERGCVACGSKNTMPLANVLNRKTEPWEAAPGAPPPTVFRGPAGDWEKELRSVTGTYWQEKQGGDYGSY